MTEQNTKLAGNADMTDEERLALAIAMMDASFEDIEELAKFVKPPRGLYFINNIVKCESGFDKDGKQLVNKILIEIGETIELAKFPNVPVDQIPDSEKVPAGSLVSFAWHGPMGIQKMRQIFEQVIMQIDPKMSPRTLIETLASGSLSNLTMSVTQRPDKVKMDPDSVAAGNPTPLMYSELVSVTMA